MAGVGCAAHADVGAGSDVPVPPGSAQCGRPCVQVPPKRHGGGAVAHAGPASRRGERHAHPQGQPDFGQQRGERTRAAASGARRLVFGFVFGRRDCPCMYVRTRSELLLAWVLAVLVVWMASGAVVFVVVVVVNAVV